MSNKITTYNINSKETISVNVGGNACIQSQSVLSIQFTNQVGSFQLLDNMDITEGQIYVTNNGEFPTIFVIADMLTPVEELYIFDDESTPANGTVAITLSGEVLIQAKTTVVYVSNTGASVGQGFKLAAGQYHNFSVEPGGLQVTNGSNFAAVIQL